MPSTIVDSHCHAALGWYEPVEVLLHQMDRNGVERAALIQINGRLTPRFALELLKVSLSAYRYFD